MFDLYCERVGPGLWGEPANVLSNVAYLVAAWAVWRLAERERVAGAAAWLLISLALAIGVGSALFHLFATLWARVLDEVPILVFQLSFLWLYCRRVLRLALSPSAGVLGGLILASIGARQFSAFLNGSLTYAPTLLLTVALGVNHFRARRRDSASLISGAFLFAAAVFVRTIDNAVCPAFPTGTHFLWHILAAAVLYLFARGLLVNFSVLPTVPPARVHR